MGCHRMNGDIGVPDVLGDALGLGNAQLAPANLLPEDVAHLRQEQLGCVSLKIRVEVAQGILGVYLGYEPLDHDAGVDNQPAHRRRSSATRRALSLCSRSWSDRRMASAR